METILKRCYSIVDQTGTELVRITIEQQTNGLDGKYLAGRVSARFQYPARSPGQGIVTDEYGYSGTWSNVFTSPNFIFGVGDFILPLELRWRGIGTLAWSLMYSTFPTPPLGSLLLRGSLNSVDAQIPREGCVAQQAYLPGNRGNEQAYVDNIKRRNEFWLRMLEPTSAELKCNEKGNGYFRGLFVDPATHSSFSTDLLITQV